MTSEAPAERTADELAKACKHNAQIVRDLIGVKVDVNDMAYVSKDFLTFMANFIETVGKTFESRSGEMETLRKKVEQRYGKGKPTQEQLDELDEWQKGAVATMEWFLKEIDALKQPTSARKTGSAQE